MDKRLNSSPKRLNKHSKNRKKQQPLKVVYITNPIKFETSASEFRALVQELTGQGAEYPAESSVFPVAAAAESVGVEIGSAHATVATKVVGRGSGLDPAEIGSSTEDEFYSAEMVENLQGMSLLHDVLNSYGGI